MIGGGGQEATVSAFRHAAETYRRRSLRRAAALRVALPTVMLVVIGVSGHGLLHNGPVRPRGPRYCEA